MSAVDVGIITSRVGERGPVWRERGGQGGEGKQVEKEWCMCVPTHRIITDLGHRSSRSAQAVLLIDDQRVPN